MTYDEVYTKKKQVKAVLNRPRNTWQNALDAIGIPSEIANGAVKYNAPKIIETYLWFCIPKEPDECLTLKAHHEAEEQALKCMKELLDYASKQLK